jgi:hypothetical protein
MTLSPRYTGLEHPLAVDASGTLVGDTARGVGLCGTSLTSVAVLCKFDRAVKRLTSTSIRSLNG